VLQSDNSQTEFIPQQEHLNSCTVSWVATPLFEACLVIICSTRQVHPTGCLDHGDIIK